MSDHRSSPSHHRLPSLCWSGLTHRGRVRVNNEDAFLGLAFDSHEVRHLGKTGEASLADCDFVFAVSDGMGGAKSGEFASRIAIDRITRLLPRAFRQPATAKGPPGGAVDFFAVLAELVGAIHHDLLHLGQAYEECAGMGATLSLAWFAPGRMFFAHVGDSRIYQYTNGLKQLSEDHSLKNHLLKKGKLTIENMDRYPYKNRITKAIGTQLSVSPDIDYIRVEAGDIFFLCSDGLTDQLSDPEITDILNTSSCVEACSKQLVDRAKQKGGKDNITVVMIKIIDRL